MVQCSVVKFLRVGLFADFAVERLLAVAAQSHEAWSNDALEEFLAPS